jgi:hypothetical protein
MPAITKILLPTSVVVYDEVAKQGSTFLYIQQVGIDVQVRRGRNIKGVVNPGRVTDLFGMPFGSSARLYNPLVSLSISVSTGQSMKMVLTFS